MFIKSLDNNCFSLRHIVEHWDDLKLQIRLLTLERTLQLFVDVENARAQVVFLLTSVGTLFANSFFFNSFST